MTSLEERKVVVVVGGSIASGKSRLAECLAAVDDQFLGSRKLKRIKKETTDAAAIQKDIAKKLNLEHEATGENQAAETIFTHVESNVTTTISVKAIAGEQWGNRKGHDADAVARKLQAEGVTVVAALINPFVYNFGGRNSDFGADAFLCCVNRLQQRDGYLNLREAVLLAFYVMFPLNSGDWAKTPKDDGNLAQALKTRLEALPHNFILRKIKQSASIPDGWASKYQLVAWTALQSQQWDEVLAARKNYTYGPGACDALHKWSETLQEPLTGNPNLEDTKTKLIEIVDLVRNKVTTDAVQVVKELLEDKNRVPFFVLGLTHADLCEFLDITESALRRYVADNPAFYSSLPTRQLQLITSITPYVRPPVEGPFIERKYCDDGAKELIDAILRCVAQWSPQSNEIREVETRNWLRVQRFTAFKCAPEIAAISLAVFSVLLLAWRGGGWRVGAIFNWPFGLTTDGSWGEFVASWILLSTLVGSAWFFFNLLSNRRRSFSRDSEWTIVGRNTSAAATIMNGSKQVTIPLADIEVCSSVLGRPLDCAWIHHKEDTLSVLPISSRKKFLEAAKSRGVDIRPKWFVSDRFSPTGLWFLSICSAILTLACLAIYLYSDFRLSSSQ